MSRYYGSGLIGLDVKTPRRGSLRNNRYTKKHRRKWLISVALLAGAIAVILTVLR